MKKLLLSIVLVLSSVVLFAQGTYKEVVYLKNGSIIKGIIVEQVPNESIKIQTADGSIFVYPMSEVQKIAKELVEPEKPATQMGSPMLNVGKMERSGRNLELDGRELSDDEILALVGQQNFDTYKSARKQIGAGRAFSTIFGVTIAAAAVLFTVGLATGESEVYYIGYIPAAVADVAFPLELIFNGIGKGRMNWVADEYNRQSRSSYSWSVSPSIMRSNVQPDMAGLGAGVTFSVNF